MEETLDFLSDFIRIIVKCVLQKMRILTMTKTEINIM